MDFPCGDSGHARRAVYGDLAAFSKATWPGATTSSVRLEPAAPHIAESELVNQISFTGLNGGEQIAVFSGEMRNPARSIGQSIWLAAPVSQLLGVALGVSSSTSWIAIAGVSAIIALSVSQYTVIVAETSRLPFVAGWDGLLPNWFTRLHPTRRTPTNALFLIVMCCFGLATVSLLGVARQEAFQLVITAAQASYGIYYLILFSIPLLGRKKLPRQPGPVVQVCATVGGATTIAALLLQLVPIIDVSNPWSFAAKVTTALLIANLVGVVFYRGAHNRRTAHMTAAE